MARKPKYDKGVTVYTDRHGRQRARFRLKGMDFPLPHPSDKGYKKAYELAMQGLRPLKPRVLSQSVGDLFERYYASARFNRTTPKWQGIVRSTLAEFQEKARDAYVADFTHVHIETQLIDRARKTDGKGGPAASIRLHEQLTALFEFAVKLGWIARNPAKHAEPAVIYKPKGFHIWTMEEIERFRAVHDNGTQARLAMELAFWTGLRRGDIATLTDANIRNGRIVTTASKTGKGVSSLIVPELAEALGEVGEGPLLKTQFGKPFSVAGLGNWFRERCNEAGLPHCSIHGLRKAMTTILAEMGASQQELKAYGQWSADAEVSVYAAGANQIRMADKAVLRVSKAGTSSNLSKKVSQKRRNPQRKRLTMAGAEG